MAMMPPQYHPKVNFYSFLYINVYLPIGSVCITTSTWLQQQHQQWFIPLFGHNKRRVLTNQRRGQDELRRQEELSLGLIIFFSFPYTWLLANGNNNNTNWWMIFYSTYRLDRHTLIDSEHMIAMTRCYFALSRSPQCLSMETRPL